MDKREIEQLNQFQNFLSYKITPEFKLFLNCAAKKILWITGNQYGKTTGIVVSYVYRILGLHPIPEKNVVYFECKNKHKVSPYLLTEKCGVCGEELKVHERHSRTIRLCSAKLPGESQNASAKGDISLETKNTLYPAFKRWLPPFLLKKDITARNLSQAILDPYGGSDIVLEYVSYSQEVQDTAGVQRMSIGFDEAPPQDFYEEQGPRLLMEDGDMVFAYTPADRSSWLFDELYDKAKIYYRTKTICDYLKESDQIKKTDSPYDIAVFQAASDDNPVIPKEIIEKQFADVADPDTLAIRRYGIFKQISGRIFKDFTQSVHVISWQDYFSEGIPYDWVHGRGVDFHPQAPWAIGFASISPQNEMFIWEAFEMSPEKYTTKEIMKEIALRGRDYKFRYSLVDPLADATMKDKVTVLADMITELNNLYRTGIGTGGGWQTWDTKGERGRDNIKLRLKNSLLVKKPFSNKVDGIYIPTVWIFNTCALAYKCMYSWRWEEWADIRSQVTKEKKNKPEQKYSHINMVWEALCKEQGFRPRRDENFTNIRRETYQYFRGNS